MTHTIGFVGFGNINSILVEYAVKAGYKVVLSNSRGPESLSAAVAKLGPLAAAATVEDAVRQSDIVSLSVPLSAVMQLPVQPFAGKVVIDSTNYYSQRDGAFEDLDTDRVTTSEFVQRRLIGSSVVKVFNSIDFFHLGSGARPKNDPERWALPLAGDDESAKAVVSKFVSDIGFDPVDCGSLAESWRFQKNTPVYCRPYIGEIPEGATPSEAYEWANHDHSRSVKEEDIRALVAKARKDDPVDYGSIIGKLYGALDLGSVSRKAA